MNLVRLHFPLTELGLGVFWTLGSWASGKDYRVMVEAAAGARVGVVVRFEMPEQVGEAEGTGWQLVSENVEGLPVRDVMIDRSAPQPVTALYSDWNLTVYSMPDASRPVHFFDLTIAQICATSDPLELPECSLRRIGHPGVAGGNGPGKAVRFLTSEGLTDRKSETAPLHVVLVGRGCARWRGGDDVDGASYQFPRTSAIATPS